MRQFRRLTRSEWLLLAGAAIQGVAGGLTIALVSALTNLL